MKTCASVFSWLFGILSSVITLITLSNGYDESKVVYYNGYYHTIVEHHSFSTIVWILVILFIIGKIIIMIWRENSVSKGNKVACGVCTLLFVSLIGGILTLCIPNDQLGNRPNKKSQMDTADLLIKYKKMLDEGIITQQEFEDKKKELL